MPYTLLKLHQASHVLIKIKHRLRAFVYRELSNSHVNESIQQNYTVQLSFKLGFKCDVLISSKFTLSLLIHNVDRTNWYSWSLSWDLHAHRLFRSFDFFHCGTKRANSSFMKIDYVMISDHLTKYFGKKLSFKFSFNPFFMNFNPCPPNILLY